MIDKKIDEVYVPLDKATWLVRNGLGADQSRMTYYTQSLQDPQRMVTQIAFRGYVAELLENMVQWVFSDIVAYQRLAQYLLSRNRPARLTKKAWESMTQKAFKAKIPVQQLVEIYEKGLKDPKKPMHLSPEQYSWNGLNHFIAEQDSPDNRREGTKEALDTYKKDTPGEKRKTFEVIKKTIRNKNK